MNSQDLYKALLVLMLFIIVTVLSSGGTALYLFGNFELSKSTVIPATAENIRKSGLTIQLAKEKCIAHIQSQYPIRKSTSIVLQRESVIRDNKANIFLQVLNGNTYSNFSCVVSANVTVERMDTDVESRIERDMKTISESAFGN